MHEISEKRFVLGVDLDGVCGDFYAALRPIAAEWLGVPLGSLPEEVSYGLTEWNLQAAGGYEELHRFAVTQRELFRKQPLIPGAAAALRRLSSKQIWIRIITHRLFIKYFHKEAVRQTIEWLDYHGIPYWDLCFLKDKAAVGADLYVEDAPENVEALRSAGLRTIVFINSTNRGLPGPRASNWEEVESLVLDEFEAWQTRTEAMGLSGR